MDSLRYMENNCLQVCHLIPIYFLATKVCWNAVFKQKALKSAAIIPGQVSGNKQCGLIIRVVSGQVSIGKKFG